MKQKRYSEEQIIAILNEAEAGAPVAELCRKHGMSDASFYNWRAKYGGMTVSEAKRLKHLEEENRKLKKLLAETMLEKTALEDLVKISCKPAERRRLAGYLMTRHGPSQRTVCRLLKLHRTTARYQSSRPPGREDPETLAGAGAPLSSLRVSTLAPSVTTGGLHPESQENVSVVPGRRPAGTPAQAETAYGGGTFPDPGAGVNQPSLVDGFCLRPVDGRPAFPLFDSGG
jgi:putative transposase